MKKNKSRGFTLVELIIVLAIIAILAAILLPSYLGFTDNARKNAALAEAKSIWTTEQADYNNTGSWPVINVGTDSSGNPQSTITSVDGTVYNFAGIITPKSPPDGSFTYKKFNWTVSCDLNGEMTIH